MRVFIPCLLLLTLSASAAAPSVKEGRGHWAFQPVANPPPPAVKNASWPQNDIDRFILAKLEAAGLQPSPAADRVTLIRRVTLDLTGLLPAPEEVEAFVKNESPHAYEALIDCLLASKHYGERWGRHWLDLARYADTSGFHNDLDRPYAWKYRDYVIRSFNEDKPYARFVLEQLAGDEVDGADEQSIIATGFCRNGPSNDDNMGKNAEAIAQYRADQMDDVISTTGSVFLGLTIGCARCHDHKTEPLLSRDYYSLMAVFNGTERLGLPKGAKDRNDKDIAEKQDVMALIETKPDVPSTHVLLRGLAANRGEEVKPAVPVVLTGKAVPFPKPTGKTSLRRRTYAEWIISPQNPLTWRVMVNRVWQHHFGAGIVASPSNFGVSGMKPTHPELLDWLTMQFLADGGKLKPLHKLMLLSATYRQQSKGDAQGQATDPSNTLLWRMNKQRMEAEVIRDCILAASGRLNPKLGGPGIKPRIRADLLDASQRNKWPVLESETAEHWRRSVYIYVKRQLLMPGMELFDAPTTTDSCALRMQSTVPTQALVLMNDEFVEDQAGFLAQRAKAEAGDSLSLIVERLFMLTLSRKPSPPRLQQALDFVKSRQPSSDETTALRDLSHVLLNSSEFVYIE
ncbi:MAG: DUF1553 domain-containing protein [Prosthecobacter sp.]|jgi:hypothetical protein|uniref:DUF1549 and DUF1553 domain-containing protein n=1 Tax=Prosthecobacter sp. TaxID=1965333 RepID=UPI001A101C18|nr:DUF1549 and DUF1553 domain-containing protein [Prosthecobacter sp.]MBE2287097.1 DUF1553 domain-containing protein [Prosthecobacter sp.]